MRIKKFASSTTTRKAGRKKEKDKNSKDGLTIEKETCKYLLQGFPFSCSKQNLKN